MRSKGVMLLEILPKILQKLSASTLLKLLFSTTLIRLKEVIPQSLIAILLILPADLKNSLPKWIGGLEFQLRKIPKISRTVILVWF